ncbi:ankyrin, partial [Coprinopsis marcescibilis]
IVKALLAVEGLDLNPKDHREASALICAAESGHNAVVKLLVQRKGISFSPAFSGGPLLLATSAGHLDVVKTLLVIDPSALNMRMSDGQTPLSRAAYRGFDDIVDYLLSFKDSIEINWGDRNNITPLMWAVFANRVSIVKKLIAFDEIDLSPIGRMNGKTALSIAVENGHTEVEELL